jgi:predicted nucleic acid-binding Zn finger protein
MCQIERLSGSEFRVKSSAGPGNYQVSFNNGISLCTCPHFIFRCLPNNLKCKHILAVEKEYPEVKKIEPTGTLKASLLSDLII